MQFSVFSDKNTGQSGVGATQTPNYLQHPSTAKVSARNMVVCPKAVLFTHLFVACEGLHIECLHFADENWCLLSKTTGALVVVLKLNQVLEHF